jgi:recombination protein RecA
LHGSFVLTATLTAISTGIPSVDAMLGGGLPRRHLTELYGPEDCAKTTIALNWVAAAQKYAHTAVYIDAERKFDAKWAGLCGVQMEDLVLVQPDSGNQALAMAESLLRTFTVDLLVIDSIAALSPEDEEIEGFDDGRIDAHTELVTRMLRKLRSVADRSCTSLVAINQMRSRLKPGTPETSSAGRALGLHAAIRLRVRRDGNEIRLSSIKNRLADPFQEVTVSLEGARLADRGGQAPANAGWRPEPVTGSPRFSVTPEGAPRAFRVAKTG